MLRLGPLHDDHKLHLFKYWCGAVFLLAVEQISLYKVLHDVIFILLTIFTTHVRQNE